MFYTKILPVWERGLRVAGSLIMALCGYLFFSGSPLGYLFAAAGGFTVLTGFVGGCPMCAMAGRKLKSQ